MKYGAWRESTFDVVADGREVTELISCHLLPSDRVRAEIDLLKPTQHYRYRLVDDVQNQLRQITIFDFDDGRPSIAVMGWQLPNQEHGPAFAIQEELFVNHERTYFLNIYNANEKTKWRTKAENMIALL